ARGTQRLPPSTQRLAPSNSQLPTPISTPAMPLRMEILQFFDDTNRSILHRVPQSGSADIKVGAQLVVQQNQEAVFYRDGQPLDRLGPGRHTLSTSNIPLLTRLLTLPWEKSPFQAQVYFVGKQLFTDQKWGTRQPIAFRDREFGMIRLRGYGAYSFRVVDSTLLIATLTGTQNRYTTDEVAAFLRDVIVARLADLLGTVDISLLDMATHYDEIAAGARARVAEDFQRYGLELVDFFINGISAPDEVQRAIDTRSSIAAVGDLATYMKVQAVRSMRELAGRGADDPAGFGVMMPGLIHHLAEGVAPPKLADEGLRPLPAEPLTFDALADLPTTRDARAMVRAVAESAGYAVQALPTPPVVDPAADSDEAGSQAATPDEAPSVPAAVLRVTLPINPLRQQRVDVGFNAVDEEGNALVTFTSVCAPLPEGVAREELTLRLLEYNARMVHGAFAIRDAGAGAQVVIQANQLADTADPLEISRLLTAVAWQADRAEEKLTGRDEN
ncbi:MAG: SPFH domain-containing protein, partial [Planctomycetota bacterium]